MSGFEFRLQGLLKLRQRHEDAARTDLADSQRRLAAEEKAAEGLAKERQAAADEVVRGGPQSITALQSAYAHVHRLGGLEDESRQRIAVLGTEHEQRLQTALDAQRARRIVEQLKNRQLDRYMSEVRREDARLTDEVGTQVAVKRAASSDPME
jgi:flagellar protein FliJ